MSSPITEVAQLPASDALKADPKLIAEFAQLLERKAAPGMSGQAWGFRLEDPETVQGFLDWPSIEYHKTAGEALEKDEELRAIGQRIVAGPTMHAHVPFVPFENYKRAVAAPLTEIILTHLKDGADLQEFKDATEYALDMSGAWEGCMRGAWGFTVENPTAAVMVLGWESREAHLGYEATQTVKDTIARFSKVGDLEKLFHVKFQ